jgi:hypothetical protein
MKRLSFKWDREDNRLDRAEEGCGFSMPKIKYKSSAPTFTAAQLASVQPMSRVTGSGIYIADTYSDYTSSTSAATSTFSTSSD